MPQVPQCPSTWVPEWQSAQVPKCLECTRALVPFECPSAASAQMSGVLQCSRALRVPECPRALRVPWVPWVLECSRYLRVPWVPEYPSTIRMPKNSSARVPWVPQSVSLSVSQLVYNAGSVSYIYLQGSHLKGRYNFATEETSNSSLNGLIKF